jgi:cytochrome P450
VAIRLTITFGRTQQDTTLPLQYPVESTDGTSISTIALKKGTQILVSIIASNRNKGVWGDDADEWRPERWVSSSSAPDKQDISVENSSAVKYPGVYSSM